MLIAAALAAAAPASAGSWKLGTGIDYTNGDYGCDDDVSTLYAPVNIKYRDGRLALRLTVPYLEVSGPGNVLDEGGQLVPGPDRTDSGLGDVIVAPRCMTSLRLQIEVLCRSDGQGQVRGAGVRPSGAAFMCSTWQSKEHPWLTT